MDLKILFVEKPICISRNEYNNILKENKKVKFKIIINHSRRFDNSHKEACTAK